MISPDIFEDYIRASVAKGFPPDSEESGVARAC
jgi:hypothetical protein